jgi:hypothetical protein
MHDPIIKDNKRMEKEWGNKDEEQQIYFRCLGSEKEISVL